jgi:2-keto-3-deoxy-L-rhamnonate aldolase RhmA
MKANRFAQMRAAGQTPIGHMLFEFYARGIARILEFAGVDFAVIDTEHSSFTLSQVADMVAWFKATPIAPFVRIPQVDYHLIAPALDVGAMGIVAPNVQAEAQARTLVDAAKYLPIGRRGLHFGGASGDFQPIDAVEHMRHCNANTTVVCMIESPEGIGNLESIAATPGVDALWVGHWDLTQYMGIPGQFGHPRFRQAAQAVVDAARRHGLAAIIQPGSTSQAAEFLDLGFNVLSYGADFGVYREALARGVADVRRLYTERLPEISGARRGSDPA